MNINRKKEVICQNLGKLIIHKIKERKGYSRMEEYSLEQITPTRKARISIGIQQVETTTGI